MTNDKITVSRELLRQTIDLLDDMLAPGATFSTASLRAAVEQTAVEPVAWLPMDAAPKDGTLVLLLVEFEDHATEDGPGPHPTIGSNTSENDGGPDDWQFAGWNWEHDCYTQGVGTPVGWLPMTALQLSAQQPAPLQEPMCSTCNDNGMIGGPSFYAPDEGGVPCPDCSAPVQEPVPMLTYQELVDAHPILYGLGDDDIEFARNVEKLVHQKAGLK